MKIMDIIVHDPGRWHASLDDVREYEDAICSDRNVTPVNSEKTISSHIPNIVWWQVYRLMEHMPPPKPRVDAASTKHLFAILMGPRFRKTMPFFLSNRPKSAYIFDAWPKNQEKYRRFADACRVDHLFVSSSQAATALGKMVKATTCHWVPEAVSPAGYYLAYRPKRDIDVLQLGRRFNRYHLMINDTLTQRGKTYVYEKEPGHIIFPSRLDLIEGLLRTKISICAPLAMTHPEKAGGIETMTMRYLQSMFSKCLVVGHAPSEMIQLFGYNPVVEIDFNNPGPQLIKILDNFEEYQPLIDMNYRNVIEHHTWRNRWMQILAILDEDARGEQPEVRAMAGIDRM